VVFIKIVYIPAENVLPEQPELVLAFAAAACRMLMFKFSSMKKAYLSVLANTLRL
jgi:hypothetical protein